MKRWLAVGLALVGLAGAIYFLRPHAAPPPTDATGAPPVAYRLAWTFDPPAPSEPPVGFDAHRFGPLILLAVAHPRTGPSVGPLKWLTGPFTRWTATPG